MKMHYYYEVSEFADCLKISLRKTYRDINSGVLKAEKSEGKYWIKPLDNKDYVDKLLNRVRGRTKHPMYSIWAGMKRRCNNPKDSHYKWYGAKGITICHEWNNNFDTFVTWAEANGYVKGLTLDRINPDDGYNPHNCRWATIKEQGEVRSNKRKPLTPITVMLNEEEREHLKNLSLESNVSMSGYVRKLIINDIKSGA